MVRLIDRKQNAGVRGWGKENGELMSKGDGISAGEEEKVLEMDRSHGSRTMQITPLKILSCEKLIMQGDNLLLSVGEFLSKNFFLFFENVLSLDLTLNSRDGFCELPI